MGKIAFLNRRIIFVAGLHGNEQMPVKALKKGRMPFVLGNILASQKMVRYIDSDLNASFGRKNNGYEARRAKKILQAIKQDDLVVDFHTTTAKTSPFVIVVNKKMLPLAAITGLKKVVVMKHNIKNKHSLIDYRDGISIEVGNHKNQKSFKTTLRVIKNIKAQKSHPLATYEVYDKILKPGKYVNFKKNQDGFFPILAGEKAYDFFGLKARMIPKSKKTS